MTLLSTRTFIPPLKHTAYMAVLMASTAFASAHAQDSSAKHDDLAPAGVMGAHAHAEGEWMFSYRYNHMAMDGNRSGTSDVPTSQVLNDFMVAPTDMRMEMHMFGAMYGWSDRLTLMAMAPYIDKTMRHVNRMGVQFTTKSRGIGDVKAGGIYNLLGTNSRGEHGAHAGHHGGEHAGHHADESLFLNLGLSLPTGSIEKRDATPLGASQKLPYVMQLGSGTVDPYVGLTYIRTIGDAWQWGAQANATMRFGSNDEGYRLGNEAGANLWASKRVSPFASVSLRLEGKSWGDISGVDGDLNPMMVPTARTDLRGGERVDALVGVNLYQPEGELEGHRLAAEFGAPLYQDLDGPQLETDYRFTLGWQKAF